MLLTDNQIRNIRQFEAIKTKEDKEFYISPIEAFFIAFTVTFYFLCLGCVLING